MSSFGYLKKLPIDKIKIDGSFFKNMDNSIVDYTFVESITNVDKAMNIETITEFVENERIVDLFIYTEVDYLQGYYIEKPKPWSFYFD
jgi:EAL domain-containing protein (putative c-di-GMP-specific phosphodiesterase class I)